MAWTVKYVRADAAGGGTGNTDTAPDAWTIAEAVAQVVAGTQVNIRGDGADYLFSSGNFSPSVAGTDAAPIWWRGFNSTPGDLDESGDDTLRPFFDFTSTWRFDPNAADNNFTGLSVRTANNSARQRGLGLFRRCRFERLNAGDVFDNQSTTAISACSFKGGGATGNCLEFIFTTVLCTDNVVEGCAVGIKLPTGTVNTTIIGNTIRSPQGILCPDRVRGAISGNSIYCGGGAGPGISFTNINNHNENVIVSSNTFSAIAGYGISSSAAGGETRVLRTNNLFHSCSSGHESGFLDWPEFEEQDDSADPFVDGPGNDMTPAPGSNGIGNAGPKQFDGQTYVSARDIGAVQSAGTGGGTETILAQGLHQIGTGIAV